MREVDSFASDSIEIWSLRIWVAVEAGVQPRLIVGKRKKDVGRWCVCSLSAEPAAHAKSPSNTAQIASPKRSTECHSSHFSSY